MLAEMQRQSQRMTQLVEDLLTLSRLEAQDALADESVAMRAMLATLRREAEALSQQPPHDRRRGQRAGRPAGVRRRNCTARSPTWSATRCATRRPAAASRSRFARDARRRRALSVQRQRLRHPGRAPAAHHRTLLPRLHQPLARERRHRPGPVDRQARAGPAPGASEIDSEVGRGSTFSCHFGADRVHPRGDTLLSARA